MARHKVLGSIAQNIVASFTSLLNDSPGGHVIDVLTGLTDSGSHSSLFIDFLTPNSSDAFSSPTLAHVVPLYTRMFHDNLLSQRSSLEILESARLVIEIDRSAEVPIGHAGVVANPYKCTFALVDTRGVDYSKSISGVSVPSSGDQDSATFVSLRRLLSRGGA